MTDLQINIALAGNLTQTELKKQLSYDEVTGQFSRNYLTLRNSKKSKFAGHLNRNGYIQISIHSRKYLAHRLAWLYVYGYSPVLKIDHKDGDTSNNIFTNLRLANDVQNARNTKQRINTVSGSKGVSWHKKSSMWRVRGSVNKHPKSLGYFHDLEDAKRCYADFARNNYGEFAKF